MRGKDGGMQYEIWYDRITPAYAGKSYIGRWSTIDREEIPPPVGGKGNTGSCTTLQSRITPAYAGKSHKPCSTTLQKRDHPRLCGEKQKHMTEHYQNQGSPPPMRGKVSQCI